MASSKITLQLYMVYIAQSFGGRSFPQKKHWVDWLLLHSKSARVKIVGVYIIVAFIMLYTCIMTYRTTLWFTTDPPRF